MRYKSAIVAVLVLLVTLVCFRPATAADAQAPAPTPAWPHAIKVNGASVEVYQPQAIAWKNHEVLTARAAIAVTRPGASTPTLGTVEVALKTETDAATDTVHFSDPRLITTHFPSLDTQQATQLEEKVRQALPSMKTRALPLQAILLSLEHTAHPKDVSLHNAPPAIFYSDKPASLVVFDGEPVLAPVGKTGLSFAVNTNWDVFSDGHSWYLLNNGIWMSAAHYGGPYRHVSHLPPAFAHIPADRNFAAVRKAIPPKPHASGPVPKIFVSTKPADIVVTNGPPQFSPIAGTGLQSVRNTNADLFLYPSSGQYYLLISGRWFSAPGLDGPWQFATDRLPPDFALIPPTSPQAHVLASVPGTSQAQLAVLQAQVPKQATLKRDTAKVDVAYAGKPMFKPIPDTSLMYAVNTADQVIGTGGRYYVCYQGAWFVGPSPTGPWALAASVPEVIYTIPPTSPLYNVTYVRVYDSTPTTVTYGYTAGYMMGFITAGVLVYGTGYYYPPVVIHGPVPVFYPYPYTYAGSVWYNPATGGWARGGAVYGPYGGVARGGTYYNPATGAWGRGGAIYGPNGGAGAFSTYNPRTGGYAHGSAAWGGGSGYAHANYYNPRTGIAGSTNQNWNPYSRWGSSTISGPNRTVNTASGSNARGSAGGFSSSTGAAGVGYHSATGNRGGAVRTQGGDTYAGRDGNVYQHSDNGWSKWNDGGWQPVNPPSRTTENRPAGATGAREGAGLGAAQSGASRLGSGTRPQSEQSVYQQLERDRQARFGTWRQGAGTDRFGGGDMGGRFGGGGFGGRFRR